MCTTRTTTPTTRTLSSGASPLFSYYYGVPFTLAAATSVGFVTSSPSDTYAVGIFTAADWAIYSSGQGARAWALHERITRADDGATLPAGSYYLGFRCMNLIQRCLVNYALAAAN